MGLKNLYENKQFSPHQFLTRLLIHPENQSFSDFKFPHQHLCILTHSNPGNKVRMLQCDFHNLNPLSSYVIEVQGSRFKVQRHRWLEKLLV
jgi:hypothetical protein